MISLIPPHRASTKTAIGARIYSPRACACRWSVTGGDSLTVAMDEDRAAAARILDTPGQHEFLFEFLDAAENVIESRVLPYEVIDSGVRSTGQIDGCWVSILHWSEDEARHFNAELKRLSAEDWGDQIRAMGAAGIKTALIQNLFHVDAYAGRHSMTADNYAGQALYPSELYPGRYPLGCEDPVEAILGAADECGMTVFLGVGLFAWFDFSAESLEWHKRVTRELFHRYGHHASLYGWYISEEMFGSLYEEWEDLPDEAYKDVVRFFREYREFVGLLTPTKPVALAPNNIRFHEFAEQWGEILQNIDILIPFAFARDPENLNIREIQEICDQAGTRFWVDMEMFAFPLDQGLVPKSIDELVAEIRSYDAVEQIFGYQFTGLMNAGESSLDLGGARAKAFYRNYLEWIHTARQASALASRLCSRSS